MNSLGAKFKAGEARVTAGLARRPSGREQFKAHNQPSPLLDAAVARASLEAVVQKAKDDFASGIAANLSGEAFLRVCSYVPRSEAFFRILERTYSIRIDNERLVLFGPSKEVDKVIEDVWPPFLSWVTEQGLELTIGDHVNEAGRVEYYVLEVWPLDDGSDDE